MIRRSVALPRQLVEEALEAAPAELKNNFNGVVRAALREFVAHSREGEFEALMAEMARDSDIRAESSKMTAEFLSAEGDGL